MKKIITVLMAVVMIALSVVPTFAVISPAVPDLEYVVIVIPTEGGDGSYEFTTEIDENGEQHVVIKPLPNPGYAFSHWEIEGPYTTKDKLTTDILDLIITGDIKVTPYYTKDGVPATTPVDKDTSDKSPQTGSSDTVVYAVMLLSLAVCGVAAVKLAKAKKN